MSEWAKVVTHPLGLAGFALFLVFAYLARAKRSDERRWISPIAVAAAVVALVAGLTLSYIQALHRQLTPPPAVQAGKPPVSGQQQTNQVQQTTTGPGSPAVQGVQGNVTITVDQSTGKTKTEIQKPPEKKPTQESK